MGFSFFLSLAQPGMDGFTNVMKRVDVMDHCMCHSMGRVVFEEKKF